MGCFLKTKQPLQQNASLALEYVKDCLYEVSFVTGGCLDREISVQKLDSTLVLAEMCDFT